MSGSPGDAESLQRARDALQSGGLASADAQGWAPLHVAVMGGDADLVDRLVEAGAPLTGRLMDCSGGSPLSLALFYAKTAIAQRLADPAVPDNLRNAAALGRSFEHFMDNGMLSTEAAIGLEFYRPLPIFPEWSRTLSEAEVLNEALTWAARNDQLDSMARLVELGADINANPYRGTALLWACYDDRVDAAAWLLDHGADPDLLHDFGGMGHGEGAAAIHLAAQFSCLDCLELLIARGADKRIIDRAHGGTPEDWARLHDADDAVSLLRRR